MDECARWRAFPELLPWMAKAVLGRRPGLRGGPSGCLGSLPGGLQANAEEPKQAAGQCWAVAANAAGPFPALIMAVLINCVTAASILLSFN